MFKLRAALAALAIGAFFSFECPDRPVYCRESWVVYAIAIS